MKTISGSIVYRGLYDELEVRFGRAEAHRIWALAERVNRRLYEKYSAEDTFGSGDMIFPAAAVYIALGKRQPDFPAVTLLESYGTKTGERIRKILHGVTSLPFVPTLIRRNLGRIMEYASSAELGYTRRIVSNNDELSAVDILSCPLYDMAKKIGAPEVCRTVCAMDKVYMTGFRRIQYRRTKSVAEGDDCCDYRLWWDADKK